MVRKKILVALMLIIVVLLVSITPTVLASSPKVYLTTTLTGSYNAGEIINVKVVSSEFTNTDFIGMSFDVQYDRQKFHAVKSDLITEYLDTQTNILAADMGSVWSAIDPDEVNYFAPPLDKFHAIDANNSNNGYLEYTRMANTGMSYNLTSAPKNGSGEIEWMTIHLKAMSAGTLGDLANAIQFHDPKTTKTNADNGVSIFTLFATPLPSINYSVSGIALPVAPVTITNVGAITDIEVANGTSLVNANLPTTVQATLSDTTTTSVGVTWNAGNPEYLATTAGTYTFTGTLTNLPIGVTNPGGITATVNIVVAAPLSANADLSDLKVSGTTVTGFGANTLSYNVILPVGTTIVPTVAATKADTNASTPVITQATNLTGTSVERTANVVVTAQNGSATKTYTVTFSVGASVNADLSDLKVNGTTVAGFAASTLSYNVTLPAGTTIVPTVTATKADTNASTPAITQATNVTGTAAERTATIVVVGTTTKTYTVVFSVGASVNADLSDLKVNGTTVAGFAANTLTYNVTLPAGTTTVPTVTATKADTNASTPAITQATNVTGTAAERTATIVVTAQDNTTTKTYTVTVTVATAAVQGPSFQNASLDTTNKIVTLVFDKALTSNVSDLKSVIKLATNGSTFNISPVSASISITDAKKLIVTFNSPLTGANNLLQIAADSLKDADGHVQTAVVTTPAISGSIDECFIATAAYGSKNQTDVVLLRHFRDQFLLTNPIGKAFVETYYHYSPPIARTIAGSVLLKFVTRVLLLPLVVIVYTLIHPVVIVGILAALAFALVQRRRRNVFLGSK